MQMFFPGKETMDEGEGDPLKRRGLPLSLHLTPWALHGSSSLVALQKSPYTIFCRPLGGEWESDILLDKNPRWMKTSIS